MLSPDEFNQQVSLRLTELCRDMAENRGVSPSRRLRLEGFMQAGIAMGLTTRSAQVDLLCELFEKIIGEKIDPASPILGDPHALPADIRIPLRYPVAGDADTSS